MSGIKMHLSYGLDFFRGPYQVCDALEVHYLKVSQLGASESVCLGFKDLHKVDSTMPFQMMREGDLLKLSLPAGSILEQASAFGWKTLWNGRDIQAVGMELCLMPQGWLRISTYSTTIDLYFKSKSLRTSSPLGAVVGQVKKKTFWTTGLSLGIHAVGIALILNGGVSLLGSLTSQSDSASLPAPSSENPVTAQVLSADQVREDYSGIGLFKALYNQASKTFTAADMTQSLKSLGKLISPNEMKVKTAAVQSAAPSQQMGTALKALQSGLFARKEAAPLNQGNSAKASQVSWKSQFSTAAGTGSSSAPSEAQQQALLEAFKNFQDPFRGCYEQALLKFEEMAVTVMIEGEISQDGHIGKSKFGISGRSTPDSQRVLESCLKSTLEKAKFEKRMKGVRFKNQFIFKS